MNWSVFLYAMFGSRKVLRKEEKIKENGFLMFDFNVKKIWKKKK